MKTEAASAPAAAPCLPAAPNKPGGNGAPLALITLAGRFAAQLEKHGLDKHAKAEKTAEQPASATPRSAGLLDDTKPLTARDDDEGGQGQWSGPTASGALSNNPIAPAQALRSAVALPDTALLDRIAAQIAEPHGVARAEAAQLALPPGSLAAGALVARGADGGLAIRITGLDPRLAPAQTLRLRSGLERALARRGVDVATLELESAQVEPAAPGDYRGRASVTSRAV